MINLEPDYKKEYEELTKKVKFFAEIMTLVAVVGLVAMFLNIIIRSI
jgi:hypothetical protein